MVSISRTFVLSFLTAPLISLLLSGCTEPPPPAKETIQPVKAIKIANYAGFYERSFPGKAEATQEVDLAFDVPGTLIERPVLIGDKVKAGKLLAKLDQRDFLASVKAAESEFNRNTANFKRAGELIKKDFISQKDYDILVTAVEVSDSALLVARKALSDTVLNAPFDGVVTNLYVENYQSVLPKQPVARLVDNSRIEFVVHIPEQYISLVPRIQNLRVRFDAFNEIEIPAQVKEIGKEASQATRTYPVNLIMEQPDNFEILPGMAGVASGAAAVAEVERSKSVGVPVTAVFSPGATGESFVWVIDEAAMTVKRRAVVVDTVSDTGITISEGLQPGEWIATAGVHYLKEGQKVRIMDASEAKQ